MGRAFAGGWVLIDLSGTLAVVATGVAIVDTIAGARCSIGFACGFVFAQASFVQTNADVGRGEADQRRRQLVEPDGPRLPLLVATLADRIRLVGGQKLRMVQTFFRRVLPRRGNYCAIFYLGAATSETDCLRTADFSSTRNRDHGQLLLFQSAHPRVVLIVDRRFDSNQGPPRHSLPKRRRGRRSRPVATIVHVRWHNRDHRDITDQRVVNLQRI